MIIKASQRGGAKQLAAHLLNANDNEHVEIHEVKGFMSNTLKGALQEAHALSKGTKCKQYLFSVSLNPPQNAKVDTKIFEQTLDRIEESMKIQGQPRVVVFHEKQGRRHAHVVWSRIYDNGQKLKAAQLSFFQNRLMEISKELYLDQGWKLPNGFIDREQRNPLNFSRDQWRQAKRLNENPRSIKITLKECWSVSKTKEAFQKSLEQRGYYLAKGDRRGYVAVDWRGEVYSLSRWLGVKKKQLKEKLGDFAGLQSAKETIANIDQKLVKQVQGFTQDLKQKHKQRFTYLQSQKIRMKIRHKTQRETLTFKQKQRWVEETKQRQARLSTGVRGIWTRITGKHQSIIKQNEIEAYQSLTRDKQQKEALIHKQLDQRQPLQNNIDHMHQQHEKEIIELKEMLFAKIPEKKIIHLQDYFERQTCSNQNNQQQSNGFDLGR